MLLCPQCWSSLVTQLANYLHAWFDSPLHVLGHLFVLLGVTSPVELRSVHLWLLGLIGSLPPICLCVVWVLRRFQLFPSGFFCSVATGPRWFFVHSYPSIFSSCWVLLSPIVSQLIFSSSDFFLVFEWFSRLLLLLPNENLYGPFLLRRTIMAIFDNSAFVTFLDVLTLSSCCSDWFPFVRTFC